MLLMEDIWKLFPGVNIYKCHLYREVNKTVDCLEKKKRIGSLGHAWVLFFKIVFCFQKHEEHIGFPLFFLENIESTENTNTIKFRKQEEFSKNNKIMLSMFVKIVLKNNFQKQVRTIFENSPLESNIW